MSIFITFDILLKNLQIPTSLCVLFINQIQINNYNYSEQMIRPLIYFSCLKVKSWCLSWSGKVGLHNGIWLLLRIRYSTKEKGETSKMPTMKIKKSHANPKAHHKTYFYCPSKQASKLRMRNEDHYDFMPGIHWPHVETNPVREMRNIGRPSDMQRVKFKFYYYNYS